MTYTNVLFDVDNTLIDSASIASNAFCEVAAKYGYHVSPASVRKLVGVPTDKIINSLKLGHRKEITSDFATALSSHKDELKLFSGIHSMLAKLRKNGINVGVVTSRTAHEVASDLGRFPEITSSKIIVTADKTTEHKPSGAPLEYAVDAFNLSKPETIYVGDAIYDMQAAQDAKIDFASATWGALPSTDFTTATHTPKTPEDLLNLVLS